MASALLIPDERTLERPSASSTSSATTSTACSSWPRTRWSCSAACAADYEEFIQVVTQVVELIRSGRAAEGRELQLAQASPLADRLERLTNELVNKAEADMVASIEASHDA